MRSTFSAFSPALCVVTTSYFSHSWRCIMILIWFLFAFLWISFQIDIYLQSLCALHWNVSIFFAYFLIEFFVLYCFYCSEGTFYMLHTAFWICGLKIFLMVCNLSFHLPIRLFHRENVSNFDAVQCFSFYESLPNEWW